MLGRSLTLAAGAALALAATPAAQAAPAAACPMGATSGWSAVSTTGWIHTAAGSFYTTAPQYDEAQMLAFFAAMDRDGDGTVCLQIGVLPSGSPPFVWPGYPPFSVIDDVIRG